MPGFVDQQSLTDDLLPQGTFVPAQALALNPQALQAIQPVQGMETVLQDKILQGIQSLQKVMAPPVADFSGAIDPSLGFGGSLGLG